MKQTAVEWLVEKYVNNGFIITVEVLQQAKEMEKEQIMDAYWDGEANMHSQIKSGLIKITAEQWYNETFKSE
jgi:hypothetical protein